MGRADDRSATSEVDRLIGAVGAGTLEWSETATRMKSLVDALNFYATEANYQEQEIHEDGRIYFVCPIEEDEQGNLARSVLTDVGLKNAFR